MKPLNILLVVALLAGGNSAFAQTVQGFEIRGVHPGDGAMESCNKLAEQFPGIPEVYQYLDIPRDRALWDVNSRYDIRKNSSRNHEYCHGAFTLYGQKSGKAVRADSINVKSHARKVYYIDYKQRIASGATLGECNATRKEIIDSLLDAHDKPTEMIEKSDSKSKVEWNYSTGDGRVGDEALEVFAAVLECKMYDNETNLPMLHIHTTVHSGAIVANAQNNVPLDKKFKPSL